ncbi:hypothetical protein A2634_05040 [Candidatus Amesbacteria bacterium RIFCSPHIGHO2_01_FULL_48_32]|uniref:dolichyl-phosphate beta-glucosyltransferase n=1 Tax=Candidatus Amesbacteria bacterium RIFCSPLOWO2_01_FULL_48_25 TaxID=1797259 RepID=A0A1F4ZCK1_9BACT|nr:MAG: hypothetical protein A2634_05040 [Candidatus Amesbacteria bacterium RIFCSPHIGHO2_01_FULL_48_32]OGD04033.1 MAG: hypothetical protein A2989_01385 [Candidatus Amesbacteria bacterium RIFCSPLOWO2_01_FULL_48_25]HJZ05703.1 dolichyl-phosphate beta-glucosyltransferase [Patescibacteria group bacterium]
MRINKIKPHLSVIIPAYNEQYRLGPHLKPVLKYLDTHYPNYELIIVDDGSTDNTAQTVSRAIAKEPRAKLVSYHPNRGKGYAIRTGVHASRGSVVLFMDADLSTPLEEIPHILHILKTADIVIGSRGQDRTKVKKSPPIYRLLASYVFDQVKFMLVGLRKFKDTQCGFKAYKGSIARQLFNLAKIDRFMFDAEILYLAEKARLTIKEIPVDWSDSPGSHVRFWEGVVNMLRDLWRIRQIHSRPVILA